MRRSMQRQSGRPMPTWSQSASSESHSPAVDRFDLCFSSPDSTDLLTRRRPTSLHRKERSLLLPCWGTGPMLSGPTTICWRSHRRAGVAGQFPRASSCSSIRLCAQPRPWPKHRSHFAVLIRISLRHARGSPMVAAMMPMLTSNTRGQGRQRKPMAFNGEVVYSGQSSMSYMAW